MKRKIDTELESDEVKEIKTPLIDYESKNILDNYLQMRRSPLVLRRKKQMKHRVAVAESLE